MTDSPLCTYILITFLCQPECQPSPRVANSPSEREEKTAEIQANSFV